MSSFLSLLHDRQPGSDIEALFRPAPLAPADAEQGGDDEAAEQDPTERPA